MSSHSISAKPQVIAASFLVVFLVGSVLAWGATARLAGAVISSGTIELASERWAIQHSSGGRVVTLGVSEGHAVEEGDLLLRFDGTQLRASRAILRARKSELEARQARALAERDNKTTLEGGSSSALEGQRLLHAERLDAYQQTQAQLEAQRLQLEAQITGLNVQAQALGRQAELVHETLEVQIALRDRGLTEDRRIRDLEITLASFSGRQGEIEAELSIARGKQTELELRRLASETNRRERAIAELREIEPQLQEATERLQLVEADLGQLEVRAPIDGVVHGLNVQSIGGVLQAGELIAEIVPREARLIGVAKIDPGNISEIEIGQPSEIRTVGASVRDAAPVIGTVKTISADVFQSPDNGQPFYRVEIELPVPDEDGLAKLPGMPFDAFFATKARTPLAYMLEPFTDALSRAMRES